MDHRHLITTTTIMARDTVALRRNWHQGGVTHSGNKLGRLGAAIKAMEKKEKRSGGLTTIPEEQIQLRADLLRVTSALSGFS
ncbi:MAG: hypothetical protein JRG96_09530 [Deltaproteobacteria bacterium]|nr:hypothetical protein [Deltaproteobacteria bacterium]